VGSEEGSGSGSGGSASGMTGQEVLVVDPDKKVLFVLEHLLTEAGMTVTAMADPFRARDQVEKRFIPVVLSDLDTPYSGGGVEMVKLAREKSPLTSVILMTGRKTFDAVAPAFRSGATDVVLKTQDAMPYIRDRVVEAARQLRATDAREKLLSEAAEVHEEFLKRMMELSRQVTDLQEKLLVRDGDAPSMVTDLEVTNVLLVDEASALGAVLATELRPDRGWKLRHAQTGGEALDVASQTPPHILVVHENLADLPATMLFKTVKSRTPDVLILTFTPPEEGAHGEVRMVDASKLLTLIPAFSNPEQMVAQIEEVRDALRRKARERRYLQAFRKHHLDFLQQYQALRQRLVAGR
jgi:two-component system OmpR family response regulator